MSVLLEREGHGEPLYTNQPDDDYLVLTDDEFWVLSERIDDERDHADALNQNTGERLDSIIERIDNLLYEPVSDVDGFRNGRRIYLNEFFEIISTDQVDGLNQRLQFFTGSLGEKINDIDVLPNIGIVLDKANPLRPKIITNNPFWENIQLRPGVFPPEPHSHNTEYYTKSEVDSIIQTLIGGSPAVLDTLRELAGALGDDPNFSANLGGYMDFLNKFEESLL